MCYRRDSGLSSRSIQLIRLSGIVLLAGALLGAQACAGSSAARRAALEPADMPPPVAQSAPREEPRWQPMPAYEIDIPQATLAAVDIDEPAKRWLPSRISRQRIHIDLQRADIHNVLRLFADSAHLNFVVDQAVKAEVTMTLKNVPWEDALGAVLASTGLTACRRGSVILVTTGQRLAQDMVLRAQAGVDAPDMTCM